MKDEQGVCNSNGNFKKSKTLIEFKIVLMKELKIK